MADTRAATRIEAFEVVAPKGTAKATPLEVSTSFNPGELVRVEVIIPDGVSYLAGLRILAAHAPAIPKTFGAWIVGNDEKLEFETTGYPSSGSWQALVYNTDIFDHTFHLRFHVADFALTNPTPHVAPIATPVIV